MSVEQIIYIISGVLPLIFSFVEYFFQPKLRFFIDKRMILYLDETERIKYQKSTAIPFAICGVIILILAMFFYDRTFAFFYGEFSVYRVGVGFVMITAFIWLLVLNKKYSGYFDPSNIPDEYIGK